MRSAQSAWAIVKWWELRRAPYNLIVGLAGIVGGAVSWLWLWRLIGADRGPIPGPAALCHRTRGDVRDGGQCLFHRGMDFRARGPTNLGCKGGGLRRDFVLLRHGFSVLLTLFPSVAFSLILAIQADPEAMSRDMKMSSANKVTGPTRADHVARFCRWRLRSAMRPVALLCVLFGGLGQMVLDGRVFTPPCWRLSSGCWQRFVDFCPRAESPSIDMSVGDWAFWERLSRSGEFGRFLVPYGRQQRFNGRQEAIS